MSSPYSQRVSLALREIHSLFISEFRLITPFKYDDVLPGERYGMLSFEEFDQDTRLQATEVFKVIRGNLILVYGYDNEADALFGSTEAMIDLDHFVGVVKEKMPTGYNVLYDVVIENSIPRSLRQPLNDPSVWIADITATIAARIGLQKTINSSHKG